MQRLLDGEGAAGFTAKEFDDAVHRFLGQTHSMLAIAQLDDLIDEAEPVNVPGTTDHPNWRRKYKVPLESLRGHPGWEQLASLRRGGG